MTDSTYADELQVTEPDEFVATTREAAGRMGGLRHICARDSDPKSDDKPATFSSLCSRKKAPRNLAAKPESLERYSAYELALSDVKLCPTCRKSANLDTYIDYTAIQQLARRYDESGLDDPSEMFGDQDSERIKVRAERTVEIDFPESAKYDLIEVARDLADMDETQDDIAPIDVEANPSGLGPADEEADS